MDKKDFSPSGFTNYFQTLIETDLKQNERAANITTWYLVIITAIQGFVIENSCNSLLSIYVFFVLSILIILFRLIEYQALKYFNILSYLFHFQLMEMTSKGEFKEFENIDTLIEHSKFFSFTSLKKSIQNGDYLSENAKIKFKLKLRWVNYFSNIMDILMWVISFGVIFYVLIISKLFIK